MERKIILSTLVYGFYKECKTQFNPEVSDKMRQIEDENQNYLLEEVLLIHRNTRSLSEDDHSGKWNGLGGKCEINESLLECAKREFYEESGIEIEEHRFKFLGFLQFPLFKPHKNEDWHVGVFIVDLNKNERLKALPEVKEGTLHFKKQSEIKELTFWPGDEAFLPYVFERKPFYGVIRYQEGKVSSIRVDPIESK